MTSRNAATAALSGEEAEDALKRMHKQASINIRQAPVLKNTFRRRAVLIGAAPQPFLSNTRPLHEN